MTIRDMVRRAFIGVAQRSLKYAGVPLRDPALVAIFGRNDVTAGVDVTEDTAMNFSAVFSAVNLISSTMAMMPMRLQEKGGKQQSKAVHGHIVNHLLSVAPNAYATPFVFRQTHQAHALTHGNAYIEIIRDSGVPLALRTLLPGQCEPKWNDAGELEYVLDEPGNRGKPRTLPANDVLHVPGLGFDGTKGYSVVSRAREGIGLGMAAEQFGASFFGRGAIPGGVLMHPGDLSPEAEKNLGDDFERKHNNANNGQRIAVLDEGMKYQQIGIPPEDAQFLQTRQFQVVEIARWYRVPPHMLYEAIQSTFANMEQQNMDFLVYTLLPWLIRWEQEFKRKLLTPDEQDALEFVHDPSVLLMPDMQTRYNAYATGRNGGWLTLNDILGAEHKPLVESAIGDTRLAPSTMRVLGAADPTQPIDMTALQAAIDVCVRLKCDDKAAREIINAAVPSASDAFTRSVVASLKNADASDANQQQNSDTSRAPQ